MSVLGAADHQMDAESVIHQSVNFEDFSSCVDFGQFVSALVREVASETHQISNTGVGCPELGVAVLELRQVPWRQ